MPGYTNRGAFRMLQDWLQATDIPTVFYLALITSAVTPTSLTNTFAALTEIAVGNGYTAGGISVARDVVDFDVIVEDDGNNRAYAQLIDEAWLAGGWKYSVVWKWS